MVIVHLMNKGGLLKANDSVDSRDYTDNGSHLGTNYMN